jgi:hypothetical protein
MPLLALIRKYRFLVHCQIQFAASEDNFFIQYSHILCPTYDPLSTFTLSGEVLASKHAYITNEQMKEVQSMKMWTYLMDRWEDTQQQSQYASMVQKQSRPGILLNIKNMTGMRVDGEALLNVSSSALEVMGVPSTNLVAVVTDNLLVMQKF